MESHEQVAPPGARRGAPTPRWVAVLTALAVLALVTAACSSGDSSTSSGGGTDAGASEEIGDEGEPVDGGTLVIAVDSESSGWNPAIDRWAPSGALIGSAILEPLAVLDADGAAQPWLATAWTPNETFDVWTIDLRPAVVFHDGTPFDAAAAKANLDFIVDAPLSGVAMKPMFDRVDVVDSDTVEVHLKSPWGAFPSSFMAGQSAFMRAPASMETEDQGSRRPVGTGPFVFEQWVPDSRLTVVANEDYWRPGEPHLDGIEYRVITDPNSRMLALQAGEVQLATTSDPQRSIDLEADFTVLRNWDVSPSVIMANVRPTVGGRFNPMSNVHARRAMAHAIDPEALAATVGPGVQIATSPFSADSPWGRPVGENGYPEHDLDAARAEVALYLEETGQTELAVTILGGSETNSQNLLAFVREQLAAAGIRATIEGMEAASLISRVVGADYEATLFGHYSSPDPDQNHYFWSASTAPGEGGININFTGFTNETTEAALTQGRESLDAEVRKDAYDTLIDERNANVADLFLYYAPVSLVAAPEVRGLAAIGEVPFANFQPKTWLGGLWLAPG
jgi:ABC-type transport system substrate-binding protein